MYPLITIPCTGLAHHAAIELFGGAHTSVSPLAPSEESGADAGALGGLLLPISHMFDCEWDGKQGLLHVTVPSQVLSFDHNLAMLIVSCVSLIATMYLLLMHRGIKSVRCCSLPRQPCWMRVRLMWERAHSSQALLHCS